MSTSRNMHVLKTVPDDVALANFIRERLEYEAKHNLDHDSRNYQTRVKFKRAGFLPKYTNDDALGDMQVARMDWDEATKQPVKDKDGKEIIHKLAFDFDLFSDASFKKLGIKRGYKPKYTEDAQFVEVKE